MPEPASRMRSRSVASSKISMQGVLQPWPIEAEVAYGTEPRTPKNRTRMRVELITARAAQQGADRFRAAAPPAASSAQERALDRRRVPARMLRASGAGHGRR